MEGVAVGGEEMRCGLRREGGVGGASGVWKLRMRLFEEGLGGVGTRLDLNKFEYR